MNTLKNLLSLNDDERLLAEVRTYQERHFAIVLVLTMIPEEMRTAFMILRQVV